MNSIKTGVVVVVLLGVLYGVYKVLNVPEPTLTTQEQEAFKIAEGLTVEGGTEADPASIGFGPPPEAPRLPEQGYESVSHLPDVPGEVPPLTDLAAGGSGARNELPPNQFQQKPDTALHPSTAATGSPGGNHAKADFLRDDPPSRDTATTVEASQPGGSFYVNRAEQASDPADQPGATQGDLYADADITGRAFDRAMYTAEELVAQGRYRDGLAELTKFHDAPSLTADEQQTLVNWLDPLAGKVIYSSEHLLEQPRVVRSGETLADIAYEYGVPTQLLHNINRSKINNPRVLLPGTELKIIRGPFRAHVSLSRSTLTLFLGELYAGHFPITLGRDPAPQPGTYYVKQIVQGREYITREGQSIPADSADNPYGGWWIDLGSEVAIHGAAANGNSDGRGCISLTAVDIADLSGILSRESQVRIED